VIMSLRCFEFSRRQIHK